MLWYKSWLETRWRFLIGLGVLLCSAAGSVITYPQVLKLIPVVSPNIGGLLGERIREAIELSRSYQGYIWSHWFRQNLSQTGTLFAVLLGTAGLLAHSGGSLFTLSLPVSRKRLAGVRAATGLVELLVLAFVPTLVIPLFSPLIGQSYGVGPALIHGLCMFIAASLFFNLAFLLSTVFSDAWRPLLIALAFAFAIAFFEQVSRSPGIGVFRVMSAETYFRGGHLPWAGLLATATLSAALYYGAVLNFARRDF